MVGWIRPVRLAELISAVLFWWLVIAAVLGSLVGRMLRRRRRE